MSPPTCRSGRRQSTDAFEGCVITITTGTQALEKSLLGVASLTVWLVARRKDPRLDHTVVLSLIAAWLCERSGSIVPAVALHAAGTRRRR